MSDMIWTDEGRYEICRFNGEWVERDIAEAHTRAAADIALRTVADDEAEHVGARDGFAFRAKYGIFDRTYGAWLALPLKMR